MLTFDYFKQNPNIKIPEITVAEIKDRSKVLTSQADRDPPNKLFYPIQKDQSFIYKKVKRDFELVHSERGDGCCNDKKGSLLGECSSLNFESTSTHILLRGSPVPFEES